MSESAPCPRNGRCGRGTRHAVGGETLTRCERLARSGWDDGLAPSAPSRVPVSPPPPPSPAPVAGSSWSSAATRLVAERAPDTTAENLASAVSLVWSIDPDDLDDEEADHHFAEALGPRASAEYRSGFYEALRSRFSDGLR